MPENKIIIPFLSKHPSYLVIGSLLLGLLFWLIDSIVDVYFHDEYDDVLEAIINPEGSELSMRLLVVVLTALVGFFARRSVIEQNLYTQLMQEYQDELVRLVEIRTEELNLKKTELADQANKDPLTNIYNRRKFLEEAESELSRSIRHQHIFSIIMLDIDNFKNINDTYGHDIGDSVIVALSELSKKIIRSTDCLARWGGEEFIILLPETDKLGASNVAEKLVKFIAESSFECKVSVTISAGVSVFNTDERDIDMLIKRADVAMYRAKKDGKNRFYISD